MKYSSALKAYVRQIDIMHFICLDTASGTGNFNFSSPGQANKALANELACAVALSNQEHPADGYRYAIVLIQLRFVWIR